ncbi:nitrite reductase (NAD(P)H) small subunit [Arthrobacter sp. MYb211]|uniref:nitrite reductase small subunit NirD n=1 Tax=unclassified Arthrobacter TaxID=235627 RepID=UPI000CFAD83D|nr:MULTISPECIES: nitrite reductase small subunit NirD [unclassified Arthrobacter]PRA12277.1 nitrite reductase (NAD(P)H) small subunit [Arthrobacter sp. MYb221]PRC08738.1 nitrite reductase (NAD(P)H) small subunit [Arthrobacter sp. MYb211]
MSAVVEEYVLDIPTNLASVCRPEDLEPGWGESALLDGRQIALFRTESGDFFAASHHCPNSGAKVMARGILGDTIIDGQRVPTVACPLHKEIYRLDTGECLNAEETPLPVFHLVEHEGQLWTGAQR